MDTISQRELAHKTRTLSKGQCQIKAVAPNFFSIVNTVMERENTLPDVIHKLSQATIEDTIRATMFSKAELSERRPLVVQRIAESEEGLRRALSAKSLTKLFAHELDEARSLLTRIDIALENTNA